MRASLTKLEELRAATSNVAFLILYDDADMPPEVFCGEGAETAARARFASAKGHWSCTLFQQDLGVDIATALIKAVRDETSERIRVLCDVVRSLLEAIND